MAYSTIPKGSLYMNNVLWTGNNTARTITGVNFQPDFTWIKSRTQAYNYILTDVLRGTTKYLSSNTNTVETTDAQTLTAFASDGFSIGTSNLVNQNVQDHVAWNWKGGGTGSSNTEGSVTATVSANQTSGFSIIKLTNPASGSYTVGHGLGVAPDMLMFKSLDGGNQSWFVLHKDLTSYTDRYLRLQESVAEVTYSMQTQVPTNSLLYLNSGGVGNGNAGLICYAFAGKQGFSKFGSYVGNGSTDGTFVYTGFSPAFVMIKEISDTGNWCMSDNKRDGYNPTKNLYADTTSVENTANTVDHCSNGFKIRTTGGSVNTPGSNMIYMAFAENPFVATSGTTAVPVTAR